MAEKHDLSKIIKELGIDVPILDTKIMGNVLVLYLYGGRTVEYPLRKGEDQTPLNPAIAKNRNRGRKLEAMKLDELRKYASSFGVTVHGKSKAQIIADIMEVING